MQNDTSVWRTKKRECIDFELFINFVVVVVGVVVPAHFVLSEQFIFQHSNSFIGVLKNNYAIVLDVSLVQQEVTMGSIELFAGRMALRI